MEAKVLFAVPNEAWFLFAKLTLFQSNFLKVSNSLIFGVFFFFFFYFRENTEWERLFYVIVSSLWKPQSQIIKYFNTEGKARPKGRMQIYKTIQLLKCIVWIVFSYTVVVYSGRDFLWNQRIPALNLCFNRYE